MPCGVGGGGVGAPWELMGMGSGSECGVDCEGLDHVLLSVRGLNPFLY